MSAKSNPEFIRVTGQMIEAAGRRVAAGDVSELAELAKLQASYYLAMETAVVGLRECGVWWSSIGEALGCSKENAVQRWGQAARLAHLRAHSGPPIRR